VFGFPFPGGLTKSLPPCGRCLGVRSVDGSGVESPLSEDKFIYCLQFPEPEALALSKLTFFFQISPILLLTFSGSKRAQITPIQQRPPNPSRLKKRRRDLLKMVHLTFSQKRSKSMSINRNAKQNKIRKKTIEILTKELDIRRPLLLILAFSYISLWLTTLISGLMGFIPFVSLFFHWKLAVFLSIKVIFFTFLLARYKKDGINLFHNSPFPREIRSQLFSTATRLLNQWGSWRKEDPGCLPNPTDRNLRATSQPRFSHPFYIIRQCRKLRAWTSRIFEIWISSPELGRHFFISLLLGWGIFSLLLNRALTMSPEQFQYISRETIPYIEVGMGLGVFTSHRSARFVLIGDWWTRRGAEKSTFNVSIRCLACRSSV